MIKLTRIIFVTLISCSIFLQESAFAGDKGVNWPGFRGTNASGVAEGYPTATTWNVEEDKNIK